MTDERTKEVAAMILEQLGGQRFITMTGAEHLSCGRDQERGQDYLQFSLPINTKVKDRPNKVRIFYDEGLDLYPIEFLRVNDHGIFTFHLIDTADNQDVEQMRTAFEQTTGLYLTLAADQ